MNIHELRKDFPYLFHPYPPVYLDNSATTQKPRGVIDALLSFYSSCTANVGRGIYDQAEKATQLYEEARKTVASFIGALPEEIIFTSGSTAGINIIAHAWGQHHVMPGDGIAISEMEHHSNLVPWQHLAKKQGADLCYIPVQPDGLLDRAVLDKVLSKKTKLVAVVHTSNVTGVTNDVQTIINKAHAVGAKVLIDAAQSVPHQKVDVHELGCDFLVFSGHKMLGPTGIGVLYIKKEIQEDLDPFYVGGGMAQYVDKKEAEWRRFPHKFEAGTPPIAQAIGLAAAIDYLQEYVDYDVLKKHEAHLCRLLIEGLSSIEGIRFVGPVEQLKNNGHLVSFVVDGVHAHDVAAYLNQQGICVRAGQLCAGPLVQKLGYNAVVRVSFYLYNTQEEVKKVVDTLKTLRID